MRGHILLPFGNFSVILNDTLTPLYTCPAGCRVVISDIVFGNTYNSAISIGFWRSGAPLWNNKAVAADDVWPYSARVFLNGGDSISARASLAGYVICSFNVEAVDQVDEAQATDVASFDAPGLYVTTNGKAAMASARVTGQKTITGLCLSQSMDSNNIVSVTTPYVAGANVANLNIDGLFYHAESALLGCGGNSADNAYMRFADRAVSAGYAARFNIVNRAIGSTNPQYFAKTGHFAGVIPLLASNLRQNNLQVDIVHFGWGSLAAVQGMSATDFRDGLRDVASWLRENGIYAPILVDKHTRFGAASVAGAPAVRTGVDMALSAALGIFAGTDLDVIPDSERFAGGHLLTTGADHSATLRLASTAAFMGW